MKKLIVFIKSHIKRNIKDGIRFVLTRPQLRNVARRHLKRLPRIKRFLLRIHHADNAPTIELAVPGFFPKAITRVQTANTKVPDPARDVFLQLLLGTRGI